MATIPKTASADEFLKKYVEGAPFETIDTEPDTPGIQPRVGSEKECIDEFMALSSDERVKVVRELNWVRNDNFLVAAYRFTTILDAADSVKTLREKARNCKNPNELKQIREEVDEERVAQRAVLNSIQKRLQAGLYVNGGRKYADDVYHSLATVWRDFYKEFPYLIDSDNDGFYDEKIPGTDGGADGLPEDPIFSVDGDGDKVPDAFDANPSDPAIFWDAGKLKQPGPDNAFDVTVDGKGNEQIVTITIRILLTNSSTSPVPNFDFHIKNWRQETGQFFDEAMPQEFKGKVQIRPVFVTDPKEPHHVEVTVVSANSGEAEGANYVTKWSSNFTPCNRAHEIGHMLGWPDRYHEATYGGRYDRTFDPGIPANSKIDDVMAGGNEGQKINPDDIKRTLAAASSGVPELARILIDDRNAYSSKCDEWSGRKGAETGEANLTGMFEFVKRAVSGHASLGRKINLSKIEKGQLEKSAADFIAEVAGDIKYEARWSAFYSRQTALKILEISKGHFAEMAKSATGAVRGKLGQILREIEELKEGIMTLPTAEGADRDDWSQRLAEAGIAAGTIDLKIAEEALKNEWRERSNGEEELFVNMSVQPITFPDANAKDNPVRAMEMIFGIRKIHGGDEERITIKAIPMLEGANPYKFAKKLSGEIAKARKRAQNATPEDRIFRAFTLGGTSVDTQGNGALAFKLGADFYVSESTRVGANFQIQRGAQNLEGDLTLGVRHRLPAGLTVGEGFGMGFSGAHVHPSFVATASYYFDHRLMIESALTVPLTTRHRSPGLSVLFGARF